MSLEMKYFVLKPRGHDVYAEASRAAMRTYANYMADVDNDFSNSLWEWVTIEEDKAHEVE